MPDHSSPGRDPAALRHHYLVERELADRLRRAAPTDRRALYRTVYNELFSRVPDHPQLVWKVTPAMQRRRVEQQLRLLRPHLGADKVFLEVGAGDCCLTMAVAAETRQAYGVDISDTISATADRPAGFSLLMSDGTDVPLPDGTVDVAYSRMLIEHLHPDDAAEHLREVHRALAPGGVYVCETPHRYSGPQDISQYFDDVATGFHLKEYTFRDLGRAFREAGFRATRLRLWLKGRTYPFPRFVAHGLERLIGLLPAGLRRRLASGRVFRLAFAAVVLVGDKGPAAGAPARELAAAGVTG